MSESVTCVRCKGPVGMGVVAFKKMPALQFRPTVLRFCLNCGGNGNNVLTREEEELLPTSPEAEA